MEILLNSKKNIASVNVTNYFNFELSNNNSEILEYNIKNAVNATEVFEAERNANDIYRIYGRIEYLSLLNKLKSDYKIVGDFFLQDNTDTNTNVKTIFNSFDFYLVRATTGYTKIMGSITEIFSGTVIDERFDLWVTATPSNYPAGWSVNVTTNSFVQDSGSNQAEFYLNNQPFANNVTLTKTLPIPVFGNLTIETFANITPSFVSGTDKLIIDVYSDTNIINSFNVLDVTTGFKEFNFYASSQAPVTKIVITANSTNKYMYMDYFKLYGDSLTYITSNVSNNSGKYVRNFEVIATPNDFELYNAGFTKNVYGEQVYAFNFNRDFDISTYLDEFNFPATELFLYARYKPSVNGWNEPETMSGTTFNIDGTMSLTPIYSQTITYGTKIYGDLVEYSKPLFYEEQSTPQLYYISTPYKENNATKYLEWEYNPFIPLRLRYFYDDINSANTGDTSYEQQISIPAYATEYPSNTGNYIWKNIIPQGQIDPLTGLGVDYPFINKRRYLFATLIMDISPNMDDNNTRTVFSEIKFGPPSIASKTPLNNINDITKPC